VFARATTPGAGFLTGTAVGWPTFIQAANHGSVGAQATRSRR
jgi:hypothetical protein